MTPAETSEAVAGGRPGGDWIWLGRVGWTPTATLQERLRDDLLLGSGRETLLLCEHDAVITVGRRARPEHLLVDPELLRSRGVELARASRGGELTYHGPGQLVAYPVLRVRRGVVAFVEAMAAGVIRLLGELGLRGEWRRQTPGVWVGQEKICSFGIHVRHRVSVHGLALNVGTDLSAFDAIVPCGLRGVRVTSIAALTGQRLGSEALPELASRLAAALGDSFGLDLTARAPTGILPHCQTEKPIDNISPE